MIGCQMNICVLGLGYVGLPLAVAFGSKFPTVGVDLDKGRVEELRRYVDKTGEISTEEIKRANNLVITSRADDIASCNFFIIAVPTPIDEFKKPNLEPIRKACETVGRFLKQNDIVVIESTVYPGATEEYCVPIFESVSGLKFNNDFFCGYSPERINPGDKKRRLADIIKITSGSTDAVACIVDDVYKSIISAGTYKAESIKVAEAAKIIENTQRDVNIALMNELSIVFELLSISTAQVLKAASTKWNFMNFSPGLVGGHCIGVDPYYLTHKAQSVGYTPEIILAGRRLNDEMGKLIATRLIKRMIVDKIDMSKPKVLVLGLAFKENCSDLRNTKVIDVITELQSYQFEVDCFDPLADCESAMALYGVRTIDAPEYGKYQAIVLAVAHDNFVMLGKDHIRRFGAEHSVFFDVKNVFGSANSDLQL